MGCKPSKPKGGSKGHATRPVPNNIPNRPQVSHRPPQQQQGHYPPQQPPQRKPRRVKQPQPYESSDDDEECEAYNPPVSSHQQQTQQQQQKQQQQKAYANDPRYQKGQEAAKTLAKIGTESAMKAAGPRAAKYAPVAAKGAQKVAGVAVDKGMDWNQKRMAQKQQQQQQGRSQAQAPGQAAQAEEYVGSYGYSRQ